MSNSQVIGAAAPADPIARVERLFLPQASKVSKATFALGLAGSGAVGAGVYGLWLAESAVPVSGALLFGGLVAIAGSSFVRPAAVPPLRVGELGVILGDPAEARRVHWCEIDDVRVVGDELRLETSDGPLTVSLVAHARAASRILAEAALRIPTRLDVAPKAHERLPPLSEAEGELVPAARLQLAGRKCALSGKAITFESDALLCHNCAALYHVSQAPAQCLRCERPLDGARSSARAFASAKFG